MAGNGTVTIKLKDANVTRAWLRLIALVQTAYPFADMVSFTVVNGEPAKLLGIRRQVDFRKDDVTVELLSMAHLDEGDLSGVQLLEPVTDAAPRTRRT